MDKIKNNKLKSSFFHNETRAQAFTYDLIVAALIFMLVVAFSLSLYTNQKIERKDQGELQQMHLKAVNAFNTILSDQNCNLGGIANERGNLSQTKISCFNSQDYNSLKQALLLEEYEFTIKITDTNTNSVTLQKGYATTKRAVSVQRVSTLNGVSQKGVFTIYEK
jgi:hypothetical protein